MFASGQMKLDGIPVDFALVVVGFEVVGVVVVVSRGFGGIIYNKINN